MPAEILYYPHFLPDPKWFRAALLFCERVDSIVPESCWDELNPESSTAKLLDRDAGLLRMLSPQPSELKRVTEVTLEDARRFLATREQTPRERQVADVSKYVMLHSQKLNDYLKWHLSNMGLLHTYSRDESWLEAEPEVAEFILTRLADAMSENLGIPSLTDSFAGFACNSLHGIASGDGDRSKINLFTASIPLLIPGNIDRLAADEYLEIRKRYAQIRVDLDLLMQDLAQYHRLDHIRDANEFRRRVEEAAHAVALKVEQIRSSRGIERVRRWVPFGIGTLISAAQPLVGPFLQAGLALGGKIVEMVGEYSSSQGDRPGGHMHTYRALADLHDEVLRASRVRRFLAPPPMPA